MATEIQIAFETSWITQSTSVASGYILVRLVNIFYLFAFYEHSIGLLL